MLKGGREEDCLLWSISSLRRGVSFLVLAAVDGSGSATPKRAGGRDSRESDAKGESKGAGVLATQLGSQVLCMSLLCQIGFKAGLTGHD